MLYILPWPVAQNSDGEKLIAEMEKMLGVPVFAYNDIQGAHIPEAGADESGRYAHCNNIS